MDSNAVIDQINELVNKGEERETDRLKSLLVASQAREEELKKRVEELQAKLDSPTPEGNRLLDQARAAVKVHSVRAREAINDAEEQRKQAILLRRELAAVRKELEDLRAQKEEEELPEPLDVSQPQEATKIRRSLRRLSPRIKSEDTDKE